MKILQSIVYLILIAGFVTAYIQGFDSAVKDADLCYGDTPYYSQYNKYMKWKEDGVCCRYALVDNMIKEVCDNG